MSTKKRFCKISILKSDFRDLLAYEKRLLFGLNRIATIGYWE